VADRPRVVHLKAAPRGVGLVHPRDLFLTAEPPALQESRGRKVSVHCSATHTNLRTQRVFMEAYRAVCAS